MTDRMKIEFDAPQHIEPSEAVELIAAELVLGEESGYVHDGDSGDRIEWRFDMGGAGIEIDRRQSLAAATLLMGFDLPQEAMAATRAMLKAAEILPGMTMGEIPPMGPDGRRQALEHAKRLIDEMLTEMDKDGK